MREHIVLERVGVVHREHTGARATHPGHDQCTLRIVYQSLAAAADQVVGPTANSQCCEVLTLRVDGEAAGEYLGVACRRRTCRLAATHRQTLFVHRRIADGKHWDTRILNKINTQLSQVVITITISNLVGEGFARNIVRN